MILPIDSLGSGRVIKTIQLNEQKILHLYKLIINNPFKYHKIDIQCIKKKFDKYISILTIYTRDFGVIFLVIKEVFRTVRPNKQEMSIDEFLELWPNCNKQEFLKLNTIQNKIQQQKRYLISKSIPCMEDYLVKNEKGISISKINFISECKNARTLSNLFLNQISPNFLLYYYINELPYLLVQHCDASLATKIKNSTKEESINYFIQVLMALYYMQENYQMTHNDLFLYSIVVQKITKEMKWKGKTIKDYNYWSYKLPSGKYIYLKKNNNFIKISDLGFSSCFKEEIGIIRADIWEGTLNGMGIPNTYEPQCDIMVFLMDLYLNFKSEISYYCLMFIKNHFQYINLEIMMKDILIPGQEYRIKSEKLKGLTAKLLLNHLYNYCPNILYKCPPFEKILYV